MITATPGELIDTVTDHTAIRFQANTSYYLVRLSNRMTLYIGKYLFVYRRESSWKILFQRNYTDNTKTTLKRKGKRKKNKSNVK